MPQAPGSFTVSSTPSSGAPAPAPVEAPRILRKPAPLAPPAFDGLPRAVTSSMATLQTAPSQPLPAATLDRPPVTASRPMPIGNREVTQPFIVHPDITAPLSRSGPAPLPPSSSMPSVAPLQPLSSMPRPAPTSSAMTTLPLIPVVPVRPPVAPPPVAVPPASIAPATPTIAQVTTEPSAPPLSPTIPVAPARPPPAVVAAASPAPGFAASPVLAPPPVMSAPAPAVSAAPVMVAPARLAVAGNDDTAAPRAPRFAPIAAPAPTWAVPSTAAIAPAVKPTRREYASWWRQLGAAIVDGTGAVVVVGGLVRLAFSVLGVKPSVQGLINALHDNLLQLAPVVIAIPVGIAVWHLLAVVLGATVGQRLFGLRLVDSRGRAPGVLRLVIRALVAGVGGALFLASPAWALLLDGRRRGFGDIIARTAAIRR